MKKTLPTQFVIERVDSPIWGLFINELNEMLTNKSVSNKIIGNIAKYYGVFIDVPVLFDEIPEGFELVSLSTYADIKQIKYELVTTYDGVETADFLCVTIHDDAPNYAGEFALVSECRHASLNDGYALRGDVITAYSGETFIRETDEQLDLVHSEYNDGWIDREDSVYGYYDRRDEGYFLEDDAVCISNEWYASRGVAEDCGFRWHSGNDEWYHEDDYPTTVSECNAGYHDQSRRDYSKNALFKVAFEVEKEDAEAGLIHYDDLHHDTGWCKENDGSLDDDGYELVSPIFDLYSDDLEKSISESKDLSTLIDAEYSDSCGGHINVSCSTIQPKVLFEGVSCFMPLLYALYEDRLDMTYSKAKEKHRYHTEQDKYSSVFIKSHLVEFRIFPAVINVRNLIWRRDLIRLMIDNMNRSELEVLKMILNKKSKLHAHLRQIFSEDRILQKANAFMKYSEVYNYKKLPGIDEDKYKNQKSRKKNDDNLDTTGDLGA
jgi:hypothetical protein